MARCTRFHNAGLTMALGLGRRTRTSTAQEGSYGPNSPSLRMGVQAMRKVQFPGPLNVQALWTTASGGRHRDRWRHRGTPGTQPAPKRAPFNSSRAAGGGGSGDHAALQKAEAALAAAQDADLPQSFIDELAQEVQSRRKEREQKKTIGARLDSASAATKRAKAAWEKARAKYQEAEAGVAAAADVLVNALEAEKVLREQARTECTKEDSGTENWMTAAELHEVLRNVLDSVEKAWPPGAQTTAGLQDAVSVARATLQATRTGNSTHEKPQLKEDREPEDGRGQQQGPRRRQRRFHDLGRRSDAHSGQEHQTAQTVRAHDDDGRGLRATLPWNTQSMRDHATSSNDRGKTTDALETTKKNVNTLHNWFHAKLKHAEECTQKSILAHPEARSSTDIDMTQTFEPTTTADGHLDKVRKDF